MILNTLRNGIRAALETLGLPAEEGDIKLEHPADIRFGDFSTNIAMALGKKHGRNPKELAEALAGEIAKAGDPSIKEVGVAGPGFINFTLAPGVLSAEAGKILEEKEKYGTRDFYRGRKAIVEYTDPNPFKLFHIGHLMTNTVGESLARIFEAQGAETKRACYQGDVGMHVAKTIWGILALKEELPEGKPVAEKVAFLGRAYAYGATQGKDDETIKKEQQAINKKIYDRSDAEINAIYDLGRAWSLEYFETVYRRLGTEHNSAEGKAFDFYFFESETGAFGREIVLEWLGKGEVFEKSDGAVVFPGEKYGLHTRVFVNSEGLPTYEAKELGLSKIKHEKFPYDISVVVTGNEINDYFKVLLKVMSLVFPDLAAKTKHLSHGMLRLPSGKMSSRTGDVITAEAVIEEAKKIILEKMKETDRDIPNLDETADQIAVGAIKYSILKQDIGKDIVFDFDKSLSFTGNSGPYLQYTYARTQSILEKAKAEGVEPKAGESADEITLVEKMLYRFPETIERAGEDYAPHHIATFLYELAVAFNSYYADHQIVNKNEAWSPYRVALSAAVSRVLENGLHLLGIKTPAKM